MQRLDDNGVARTCADPTRPFGCGPVVGSTQLQETFANANKALDAEFRKAGELYRSTIDHMNGLVIRLVDGTESSGNRSAT